MQETTIAAIATAPGAGGIAVVRLSGAESYPIAARVFRPANAAKKVEDAKGYTAMYGTFREGDEAFDEGVALFFRAPHSYTGEDVVELSCHGGSAVARRLVEACLAAGAQPAAPGEYTRRAFLNGKLGLTQAEAVMDVISAKSAYALKSSESQLRGTVKKAIRAIRKKLIYEIAFIESALDDPEHISLDGYPKRLAQVVAEQKKQVEKLLASADEGKMIQEGIKTVILGKPNAGKSSLLNLLAGEEKAIVTDIAGTTRDVLEENLVLKGISLRILDTAGIRKTADTVEKIGVDRALEHAKDADLILYVVDASVPLDENDAKIMEILKGRKAIVLLNKSDLTAVIEKEEMEQKTGAPVISISAREETGMEELEEQMKKMFFQGEISFNDEVYITNARHKQALLAAKKSLELTAESIEMGMPEDFFSIDLMNAYEELGSIIGEAVGEDLVNEIFSKFCTGK